MFTYMVTEQPQGINSIEDLIDKTMSSLTEALKMDLKPHVHTLQSLASQIAVTVPGLEHSNRLFAIELETPDLT